MPKSVVVGYYKNTQLGSSLQSETYQNRINTMVCYFFIARHGIIYIAREGSSLINNNILVGVHVNVRVH